MLEKVYFVTKKNFKEYIDFKLNNVKILKTKVTSKILTQTICNLRF